MNLHPSFQSNSKESQRILELHKKATNNLYLIKEQNVRTDSSEVKKFKLPNNTFSSGQFKNFNKVEVDKVIEQMNEYLKNYPIDQTINVEIESSESKVPTVDLGYKEGQLSQFRADELEKYVKNKLPNNVKITKKSLGAQGPKWDKDLGKNNPQYTEWQYVSFNIIGQGKKQSEICDLGFYVIIDYKKEWCKPNDVEELCHKCDNAIFLMWANGIPLVDKQGSSEINLNNDSGSEKSGPSKVVRLDITENQKKIILEKNPEEILITYGCALEDCHSSPMHVTIINSKGDILLPSTFFTSKDKRLSNSDSPIKLLKMDKCGKIISMSDEERFPKTQITPKIKSEKRFQLQIDNNSYTPESLYELYKFVGPDQIFRIPLDQLKKFGNYETYQNSSWKSMVKQLKIEKDDLKRLSQFMTTKSN